jgi:hypothetical protein
MNLHERVYRSLLVMHPKAHRREYGEPMTQLVRDRFRDESGGIHTVALWCQIAGDLARSALSERTETTVDTLKKGWWRFAAALISTSMAIAAIGNLLGNWTEEETGQIALALATLTAAALVFGGIATRRRHPFRGSMMIGIGVLPAVTLISVPWFPLLAAAGVLAGVVAVAAFVNAASHQR